MRRTTYLLIFITASFFSCKAQSPDISYCQNEKFNAHVAKYLSFEVPVMSVQSLYNSDNDYVILDAREKKEFETSHIPGALHIGYKNPDFDILSDIDKSTNIVIYCSIGYRSEKIGIRLSQMGFKDVTNLYGSIFEWANQNYPLVDKDEKATNEIHGYNKKWSQWISNENLSVKY